MHDEDHYIEIKLKSAPKHPLKRDSVQLKLETVAYGLRSQRSILHFPDNQTPILIHGARTPPKQDLIPDGFHGCKNLKFSEMC